MAGSRRDMGEKISTEQRCVISSRERFRPAGCGAGSEAGGSSGAGVTPRPLAHLSRLPRFGEGNGFIISLQPF